MLALLSEKDGEVFDLSFSVAPTYYSKSILTDDHGKCDSLKIVQKVPGLYIVENLMSQSECLQLFSLSEKIGYTKTRGIGTGTTHPPDKFFYCITEKEADTLFNRCAHLLPQEIKPVGLNPWFRLYKYNVNSSLNPHYDRGNYCGTAVDSDGELRYDYYKDDRISQMSCLIYLNDDIMGGETVFYNKTINNKYNELITIKPKRGNAVFFYHGEHKLSPLHEGAVVRYGTKYIIRTDLLCKIQ